MLDASLSAFHVNVPELLEALAYVRAGAAGFTAFHARDDHADHPGLMVLFFFVYF